MGLVINDLIIDAVATGSVRCIFCTEVSDSIFNLQEAFAQRNQNCRLVARVVSVLPGRDRLLGWFVESLAESSLLLWPDWYDGLIRWDINTGAAEWDLTQTIMTRRLLQTRWGLSREWLTGAAGACFAGRAPVLPQFSAAAQVQQLSLALSEGSLVIAVGVEDMHPPAERLLALSRAAEWLAREASAQVVLLLPSLLADRTELDGVNFDAIHLTPPSAGATAGARQWEEEKHRVCPLVGRPHPASPGEQRLAAFLNQDALLAPLFRFNQWVTTAFESNYLVDLLWAEGRVVVEVDGYGYHSTRSAFNADRRRDYELHLSGYLVLRLPHDLVVEDVEAAAERIREFVAFRRKYPFVESEVHV